MKSAILIIILLALGAVYFFLSEKDSPVLDLNEGVIIQSDGSISGNYSIEDMMSIGTPYECSFNKTDSMSQVSGLIRMADNKIRGDFDIQINPQATNFGDSDTDQRAFFASHFILKDATTYTWTSLQNIGYKSKVVESSESNASKQEQAQIIGLKDKVNYKCKPWNAVLNAFDVPTGIDFREIK